jgi:plasmid stabilization system protein ParE
MAIEVRLAPEAERDVAEAYAWYEQRRSGLGEQFLTSLEACLHGISRYPAMCPVVHEGYRRCLIRRFPYAVFYEHEGQSVTVYGVFHTARDPQKWRQRLP